MDTPKDDRPAWETREWELAGSDADPLDADEELAARELWKAVRWLANYNQFGESFDPRGFLVREPRSEPFGEITEGDFAITSPPPCSWEHSIANLEIEHHKEFWIVRMHSIEASSSWHGEGRGRTLLAALKDLEEHAG